MVDRKFVQCQLSGAADNSSDFDGNTLLLECENNDNVYISGLEIFQFKTDGKIIDYISLMGKNLVPYTIKLGENYTNFLYNRYKFIENDKIEEGTLLNRANNSLESYDYHVENCGKDAVKKLKHTQVHTCWPGVGEDIEDEDDELVEEDEKNEKVIETVCTNGNNGMVKIFK